jgi:4-carboxymuconolactone decarboxylase
MRKGIAKRFQGFVAIRDDGAFAMEPLAPRTFFRQSELGPCQGAGRQPSLPKPVLEVAILVTDAHFKAAYELYAHVLVGEQRGLSDEKPASIVAGQRPVDTKKDADIASFRNRT